MTQDDRRPLGRRLAWFVLLWLAGVGAVFSIAWMIRLAMGY